MVTGLTSAEDVQEGGEALDGKMDAWIERLLQKELRTFQTHHQFEARQLMRMKDLLDEMGGNELPLNQGMRDVTGDYLTLRDGWKRELGAIRDQDIRRSTRCCGDRGSPSCTCRGPSAKL